MRVLVLFAVMICNPALADEAVEVEAAVLTTLAHDYDGMRVRTEMSKVSVLTSRAMGCSKDEITIMLGPRMRAGEAPAVTATQAALCILRAESADLIALPMGTGLVFEGDVKVKGSKTSPRITMSGVSVLQKIDMMSGEPIE